MRPAEAVPAAVSEETKEEARTSAARSHTYRGQLGPTRVSPRLRDRAGMLAARRRSGFAGTGAPLAERSKVLEAVSPSAIRNGPATTPPGGDAVRRVGARIDVSRESTPDRGDDGLDVKVTLFAESERRHWETRLEEQPTFSLAAEDLEDDVRNLVVPHRLNALEHMLATHGIETDQAELEDLPFVVEVGRGLERELAKRRLADRS
jgi:hypothetical protein